MKEKIPWDKGVSRLIALSFIRARAPSTWFPHAEGIHDWPVPVFKRSAPFLKYELAYPRISTYLVAAQQ